MGNQQPRENEFAHGLKVFYTVIGILTQLLYVFYLVYALRISSAHFVTNTILLSVSVAYLIFFICMSIKSRALAFTTKRMIKHIYTWSKLAINFVNLFITVQVALSSFSSTNLLYLLLASIMFSFWIVKVFTEIVLFYIERQITKMVIRYKNDRIKKV